MPEQQYKTAQKNAFAASAPAGSPALKAAAPEAVFLNPGPKALLLVLIFCLLSAYAHLMHGLGDFSALRPGGPTSVTTAPPQAVAPQAPQQAGTTQPPPQQAGSTEAQPPADDPALAAQRERVLRLGRTPRLLSSQSFTGENLRGLSLSGASISKATFNACNAQSIALHKMRLVGCAFNDSDLSGANIREVTFEDCVFENTNMDEATLFNVNFINCVFTGTKREQGFSRARIAVSRMYNVLFEGAQFEGFLLYQVSGRIDFKKTDLSGLRLNSDGNNRGYPKIDAAACQLELRLDECAGGNFELETRHLAAELKINKADFDNVKMHGFPQIQIDNSHITGLGYIAAGDWLVVKNSTLCADLKATKAMYLVNNSYISQRGASRVNSLIKDDDGLYHTSKLRPTNGADCYIIGGADGAWLTTFGGNIHISDLKIRLGYFELDNTRARNELNLKNVTLEKGHLYNSELDAAYWENVKIAQPMTSRNARAQKPLNVQAVKLSLPEGQAWIDSDLYSITEVAPRPWPKPEIPQIK